MEANQEIANVQSQSNNQISERKEVDFVFFIFICLDRRRKG